MRPQAYHGTMSTSLKPSLTWQTYNDNLGNETTSLPWYNVYFFKAFPDLALLSLEASILAPRVTFFLALALLDFATGFLAPKADFLTELFFPAPLTAFFPAFILATFLGALDAAFPKPCFCWVLSFLAAALAASAMRLFSS